LRENPTELRAFLVTDIRGYTRFSEEHGDDEAARLASAFARLAREVVEAGNGKIAGIRGDEVIGTFTSARHALQAAVALQARFTQEMEADPSLPLKAGIGLAAGEVIPVDDGYQGRAVNLAERLCSMAEAGEILASDGLVHLAGRTEGVETVELRELQLTGFADPVRISQVLSRGAPHPSAAPAESPSVLRAGADPKSTLAAADGPAEQLHISLLGGFRVTRGGRVIEEGEWRLKKAATLVKLLALSRFHRLHREQALDVLWPDLDPAAASNNLHHALHVARRILDLPQPEAGRPASRSSIRLQNELISLEWPDGIWVDVEAFDAVASQARQTGDIGAYRTALDLYGGDLLPEDLYEDWATDRRAGLRNVYHGLLLELAELYEARSQLAPAIDGLQRAVADDPTLEEAHAGLMRLYARAGQRHQALRQYELLRQALDTELGVEPDSATQELYAEIQAGAIPIAGTSPVVEPSRSQAPEMRRHNLPVSLTSFVGREREQQYVEELVVSSRLLTLTGAGGVGKSRLAMVVARDLLDRFADGVRLVELGSLSDASLVPQAVADVLDVRERASHEMVGAIVDRLQLRELLLILDNCEHLIDACATLAETLLSSCPRLMILVTSRESLGVPGEVTWTVPPLGVPDFSPGATDEEIIERLSEVESVQLFVERARQRQPSFSLAPSNVRAVVDIARRLDGLPLAIELAAARVGVLSPQQIAERLEDALALLTQRVPGGRRTALPQHQTLRATLDWSYELLDRQERALFNRLSVFAGGWTLDGAERLGAGPEIPVEDVLDVLSRLMDKSLALASARPDGVRYRMLRPIRQYGLERLAESGEAESVHRLHASEFLWIAEEAEKQLKGADQNRWLRTLDTELDNIRAALGWALQSTDEPDTGRLEIGLRIAGALWQFWHSRGHIGEGRAWLRRGLEQAAGVPAAVRAKALQNAGFHAHQQNEVTDAVAQLEESLEIYRGLGDKRSTADVLERLGDALIATGDHEAARERHEESLAIRRTIGDHWGISKSLNSMWLFLLLGGDPDGALAFLEEALVHSRTIGDQRGIAMTLHNIGMVALESGRFDQAFEPLAGSLEIFYRQEDKRDCSFCLEALARLAGAQGMPRKAARLFGAAAAQRADIDDRLSPDRVEWLEQAMNASRSEEDERSWHTAWEEGHGMPLARAVEYALSGEDAPARPQPPKGAAADGRPSVLSPRELEVAGLITEGLTNRQIAARLIIAERTVDTHVGKILSKLELSSRAQVAAWITAHRKEQVSP
jgi:predicted ATPase/DNA-binding SARP family transcriptional activator/class 3 adenylate cyclase/DNA-binding CsgD family transcriptional regulator